MCDALMPDHVRQTAEEMLLERLDQILSGKLSTPGSRQKADAWSQDQTTFAKLLASKTQRESQYH
jgi:hypothetical protein